MKKIFLGFFATISVLAILAAIVLALTQLGVITAPA